VGIQHIMIRKRNGGNASVYLTCFVAKVSNMSSILTPAIKGVILKARDMKQTNQLKAMKPP